MKISLILIFISSLLLSQDQDKQLRNFFNDLKNKTILVEIVEENSFFNANISLKDSKIYFETLASDSTISLFEKNLITSFNKCHNCKLQASEHIDLLRKVIKPGTYQFKNFPTT